MNTTMLSLLIFLAAMLYSSVGLIGSELGSRRLAPMTMRRLLALALVVAGLKLLLT